MTIRVRRLFLGLTVFSLAVANLGLISRTRSAQDSVWWKNYHWTKSRLGTSTGSAATVIIANNALTSWRRGSDLSLGVTSYHSDITVYDGDYGEIGWRGLANVWSLNTGEITHCHARLNRYYTSAPAGKTKEWRWQGTYCMEFGHCFGLDHDLTRGCMNGSAMNGGLSNTPSPENVTTLNSRY